MGIDELFKYVKFVVGGGIGLLINLAVTYNLNSYQGISFPLSYAFGLTVNIIFNFFYHRHFTFSQKDALMKRFYKFIPLTLAITAANYGLVLLFAEVIIMKQLIPVILIQNYYNYLVIIAVTGIVSIVNYTINRLWVFK